MVFAPSLQTISAALPAFLPSLCSGYRAMERSCSRIPSTLGSTDALKIMILQLKTVLKSSAGSGVGSCSKSDSYMETLRQVTNYS